MADSPVRRALLLELFPSPRELFVTSSTLFKHAASISRHPSNAPLSTANAPPVFPRRRLVLDKYVPLGSLAAPAAAKPAVTVYTRCPPLPYLPPDLPPPS